MSVYKGNWHIENKYRSSIKVQVSIKDYLLRNNLIIQIHVLSRVYTYLCIIVYILLVKKVIYKWPCLYIKT